MVSVMSASRYVTSASQYQSRSLMYIRGLIPINSTELAEAVPIGLGPSHPPRKILHYLGGFILNESGCSFIRQARVKHEVNIFEVSSGYYPATTVYYSLLLFIFQPFT